MNIYIQEILADCTSFLIKPLVMVINRHYGRSVKGILSEPTRRFRHTRVSSMYPPITCNRGNKTLNTRLYSARLTDMRKIRLQGYARLSGLWVIASAGSITKCVSLYSISLAVIISSLTIILCKHLCYFQAGDKQSEPFFHLSYSSSYYGARL